MPPTASRRAPRTVAGLLLAIALGAGVLPASAAVAASADSDGPGQVIDQNQQQGTGRVVLSHGHADFGATFGTGEWALQIHDDTTVPRYWRDPDDVVLQVTDAAMLTVPDDESFSFLGMPPGDPVHVVPQTEEPGVIWVGWNTQEPTLLDSLSLGATLRIHAIEGPGDVVAYLQGGNFGAPQPLWSTHDPFPQEAWIEVNTHTHANWVFGEPGVYLVDAEFTGDLVTGETFSARGTLRFAVGDATDPSEAFAASLSAPVDAANDSEGDAQGDADGPGSDTPTTDEGNSGVWLLVGAGATALVIAVVAVAVASARSRRRARDTEGAS